MIQDRRHHGVRSRFVTVSAATESKFRVSLHTNSESLAQSSAAYDDAPPPLANKLYAMLRLLSAVLYDGVQLHAILEFEDRVCPRKKCKR